MSSVHITSDGTLVGSAVYVKNDDGTMTLLESVTRVSWEINNVTGQAIAHVSLDNVHLDADAKAYMLGPSMVLTSEDLA